MKIVVYSKKGGEGKTPIATAIALTLDYALASNEDNDFEDIFPEERILQITHEEEFPVIDESIDVVFDLGGVLSENSYSVLSAVKQSDLVFIPISMDKKSIKKGIETYLEVSAYNSNIVILATKVKKRYGDLNLSNPDFSWSQCKDTKTIRSAVELGTGDTPKVIALQYSDYYSDMFSEGKTFEALRDESPVQSRHIQKIIDQFSLVIDEIKENEK